MAAKFKTGDKCNWVNQPERLVYLGHNWSGNGYWHQFALLTDPTKVWCEILTSDLERIELTESPTDEATTEEH